MAKKIIDQPSPLQGAASKYHAVIFLACGIVLVGAVLYAVMHNRPKQEGPVGTVSSAPAGFRSMKIVTDYQGIAQSEGLSADHSMKRVVLAEIPAGTEILSVASEVTEPFRLPNDGTVNTMSFHVEREGVVLSNGDVAELPNLNEKGFKNGKGEGLRSQFGMYSFQDPVYLVLNVQGANNADLRKLKSGSMEMMVTVFDFAK